jgi:DnaJ-domain-containing protein 1
MLPSRLSASTLGDVLGTLLREGATGVLALSEVDALGDEPSHGRHLVHLVAGRPVAVRSGGARLGELLSASGRARAAEVERALGAKGERLSGEALERAGCCSPEDVRAGLREQTRIRLERLFQLRDARLSFHAALFDGFVPKTWRRAARTAPRLTVEEFLHGRPRARVRVPKAEDARTDALRTLGVDESAGIDEIRRAYKRLVLARHPDRSTTETERLERTRELARITSAYHRLTNA